MRTNWKTVLTFLVLFIISVPAWAQGVQQAGTTKPKKDSSAVKPAKVPLTELDSAKAERDTADAKIRRINIARGDSIREANALKAAHAAQLASAIDTAQKVTRRTITRTASVVEAISSDTGKKARSDKSVPVRKEEVPAKKPTPTPSPVAAVKPPKPDSSDFYESRFARRIVDSLAAHQSPIPLATSTSSTSSSKSEERSINRATQVGLATAILAGVVCAFVCRNTNNNTLINH
ncbi:MAG: hypothetical protein JWL80_331 [Parcubacteria group bacterium]|nr:hypothetical protein [Parcubacteria group bacterium]